MKKVLLLALLVPFASNAQLKELITKTNNKLTSVKEATNQSDIATGLKEALQNGVDKQVVKLTSTDGFYKNQAVKILLPQELRTVDKALRAAGMRAMADEGILLLNRAAEEAVKESTPIFVDAIKNMKLKDAKEILMGRDNAATVYLQSATTNELYEKFLPVVSSSLGKVGADKVWSEIMKKYNALPMTREVKTDLNDYVTNKALEGVFKMIAVEEIEIRNNVSSRTTPLLQSVFAQQDKK
ncbi:MAG: DUF4197 domain-containing protein [Flavobacterium sp.]|nr:DUF4197 domain-containing protein [Flavobacterium sp.]